MQCCSLPLAPAPSHCLLHPHLFSGVTLSPLVFLCLWRARALIQDLCAEPKHKTQHFPCVTSPSLAQLANSSGYPLSEQRPIVLFRMGDSEEGSRHAFWNRLQSAAWGQGGGPLIRVTEQRLTAHRKERRASFWGCRSQCHVCIHTTGVRGKLLFLGQSR